MTILIRPADEADHAAIVAFQAAMALETEGLSLDAKAVAHGVSQVLAGRVPGRYLVAESDGTVIACLMENPEWSDWSGRMQLWLNSIYVVPARRRDGVLRALFHRVVADADPETTVRLKLYVDQDNEGAVRAYQALGMEAQHYRLFEFAISAPAA